MATGVSFIDKLSVLDHGGLPLLFEGARAPSTCGTFLRHVSIGHEQQLENLLFEVTANLVELTGALPGIGDLAWLELDTTVAPVCGQGKEGAAFSYTQERSLNPMITTLCTARSAPMVLGTRLRGGDADTRFHAASMVRSSIRKARKIGATGTLIVRVDSGYFVGEVIHTIAAEGAFFSVTMPNRKYVRKLCKAVPEGQWSRACQVFCVS